MNRQNVLVRFVLSVYRATKHGIIDWSLECKLRRLRRRGEDVSSIYEKARPMGSLAREKARSKFWRAVANALQVIGNTLGGKPESDRFVDEIRSLREEDDRDLA